MRQNPGATHWTQNIKERIRPYYLKLLYFQLGSQNRPQYFRDCWNIPTFPLEKAGAISGPVGRQPEFLFLPMIDWHTRMQRSQHLAKTLAEQGSRCWYLNPHLGREFPAPYTFSDRSRLGTVSPGVTEVHVHLPREPVFHHRMLRPDETQQLVTTWFEVLQQADVKSAIQLVSFPIWMELAQQVRQRFGFPIIYDCHDHLAGFDSINREIADAEMSCLQASDWVLFSSSYLEDLVLRELPELGERSSLVRNGVRVEDFASIQRVRRPGAKVVVGYVGAIEKWFDAESVVQAARRHPDWQFRLIGRIESDHVAELRSLPNVEFVGEVPYHLLAEQYREMTAAIIPFLDSPLTQAANPIKLYEYFAFGLPVVSARLAETELYPDLVYLARTPDEFTTQLELAVAEQDEAREQRRRAVAKAESWLSRSESIYSVGHALLEQSGRAK